MNESNSLIAQPEDDTEWYSGVGLFESVSDLSEAISSGSWVDAGLGMVGLAAEAASLAVDPLGTLASYGVGWLIDHVQPLQDALDYVAGDPAQIAAYAKTWENVSARIAETVAAQENAVSADVAEWTGAAATAYKARATETSDALNAAVQAASAASTAITMAGEVVSAVRDTVKDLVAQAVGRLAAWAAEALFSFGVATPVIAAQAATYVAKTLTTITKLFSRLVKTMAKLRPLLAKLKDSFQAIAKKLKGKNGDNDVNLSGSKKNKNDKGDDSTDNSTKPSSTDTTKRPDSNDNSTNPSATDTTKPQSTDTTKPSSTDTTKPQSTDTDQPKSTDTTKPQSTDSPTDTGKPKNPSQADLSKQDEKAPDKARENDPKDTQKAKEVTESDDPVDIATGEFLLPEVDLDLPGVLALVLRRRHRSDYRFGRWFGPSWSATLDMRIVVDQQGVTFLGEDGILLTYPHTTPDFAVMPLNGGQRWSLTRSEDGGYRIIDPDREVTWHFNPNPVLGGIDVQSGNYAITGIVDRHQNWIHFRYDSGGAPIEILHSGGYRVHVDTAAGRVTALSVLGSDPSGEEVVTRVAEFGYTAGELISVINGSGATTRYTYDHDHRLTSWTDSNGNQMVNTYDGAGRVVRQRGTAGILDTDFNYFTHPDGSGSRTTVTDSIGAATIYEFDQDLRLRDLIDAMGYRTHTDYYRRKPVRRVGPDGSITAYHHTPDGDLAKITRPDGKIITIGYQAHNQPTAITDADGGISRREYDSAGNLTAVIDRAGVRIEYSRHQCGAVNTITQSSGARTAIAVDAAGLPTRVTNPRGGVTRIIRDHFGRPITIIDPLGAANHFEWTVEGKPLRHVDADGNAETWEWDGEGNLLAHRDRAGNETRYTYGAFDLLATRSEPDGATTHYEWDTQRRLRKVVNPLGNTWHYDYDRAGRVAAEIDYNGARTCYEYDLVGRVATITPATGIARHHTYDLLGRLLQVRADTGEWIRYTYDLLGRTLSATSGTGETTLHTVEFTYTASGEVATQQLDFQPPMRYEYDAHDRRTGRITPSGARTRWSHDVSGRVTALESGGRTIDFSYDELGRSIGWNLDAIALHQTWSPIGKPILRELTARSAPGYPESERQLLQRDEYSWRADGYPSVHIHTQPDLVQHRRDYTLDSSGRITSITDDGFTTEYYKYDALDNITSAYPLNHFATGVELQPAATSTATQPNAVDRSREYQRNQLIRDGRTRFEYDDAGRLIRKTTARLSGKLAVWRFYYNAFDQLTDVHTPDHQWWQYTYDALGRRITKRRLADDRTVLESTAYTWDDTQLIEESSERATTRWHYQPGTYTPIAQSVDLATTREFHAVITDLIGNPVWIADPATGRTLATASATLWGSTIWRGRVSTSLRFPGQIHDPETGLHYNHNRIYDPDTGRYLTIDPLGLAPARNPSTYPRNPTFWSDPLGLYPGTPTSKFPDAPGEAIVYFDFSSQPPHALISIRSGDEWLHTEQFGGMTNPNNNGVSTFDPSSLSSGRLEARLPLTNPEGAMAYAEVMMSKTAAGTYPPYNLGRQSCVSYCAQVLRAGGVDIPTNTKPATDFLGQYW
ncbi:DUF6531 domain-containing protein [Nocardia xishanensis]